MESGSLTNALYGEAGLSQVRSPERWEESRSADCLRGPASKGQKADRGRQVSFHWTCSSSELFGEKQEKDKYWPIKCYDMCKNIAEGNMWNNFV